MGSSELQLVQGGGLSAPAQARSSVRTASGSGRSAGGGGAEAGLPSAHALGGGDPFWEKSNQHPAMPQCPGCWVSWVRHRSGARTALCSTLAVRPRGRESVCVCSLLAWKMGIVGVSWIDLREDCSPSVHGCPLPTYSSAAVGGREEGPGPECPPSVRGCATSPQGRVSGEGVCVLGVGQGREGGPPLSTRRLSAHAHVITGLQGMEATALQTAREAGDGEVRFPGRSILQQEPKILETHKCKQPSTTHTWAPGKVRACRPWVGEAWGSASLTSLPRQRLHVPLSPSLSSCCQASPGSL